MCLHGDADGDGDDEDPRLRRYKPEGIHLQIGGKIHTGGFSQLSFDSLFFYSGTCSGCKKTVTSCPMTPIISMYECMSRYL